MLRRMVGVTAMTAASLGLGASPALAQANVARFPDPTVMFNICAPGGEMVSMNGTIHQVDNVTGDGTNALVVEGHFTGTGTSGDAYVINVHERIVRGSDGSFDARFQVVAVSLGSGPNEIVGFHLSFPPFQVTAWSECTGQ